MKLIANWRQSWRLWSVRVSAIGAAIFALLLAAPDFLLSIWSALPAEVQGLVPNSAALGLIVSLAAGVARIVQQRGGKIDATTIAEILERITAAENVAAVTRAELQTTIGSTVNGASALAERVASIERTLVSSPIGATHRLVINADGHLTGISMHGSGTGRLK